MTSTQANHPSVMAMVPWFGAGLALLLLLYLLSPILAPFVLAGILAYIANPLVDGLSRYRLPRVLAVTFVLLGLGLIFAGLVFVILPLLIDELGQLAARVPTAIEQLNQYLMPWLSRHLGISLRLDTTHLNKLLVGNWDVIQPMLGQIYTSAKIGSMVFLGVVINAVLVPVVTFYLLLDWHGLIGRLAAFIPRRWLGRCQVMAYDIDGVLAQYLRGQISVMLILAVYYSAALWLADIPSALSVGLVSGLLVFIPYLGFATGFSLALLIAAIQFTGLSPIIAVLIIYGIGQLLESFLLTPYLVGERIGLHPLAVIFGLLAFGQLLGFFGILLALPLLAILAVAWRDVRTAYLASRFYQHES